MFRFRVDFKDKILTNYRYHLVLITNKMNVSHFGKFRKLRRIRDTMPRTIVGYAKSVRNEGSRQVVNPKVGRRPSEIPNAIYISPHSPYRGDSKTRTNDKKQDFARFDEQPHTFHQKRT